MALTYAQAKAEQKRRKYPHKIVPVLRHASDCLVSDGTIIHQYPCTCHKVEKVGYTLVLK